MQPAPLATDERVAEASQPDETANAAAPRGPAALSLERWLPALRLIAISLAVAAVIIVVLSVLPAFSPWSPLARYGIRVTSLMAAGAGLAAYLWCRRTGGTWDADLIAAAWGAVGATTLLVSLRGTPFGPLGIQGDQSFRTEYITRFASGWSLSDYFYQGRPSYYAPTYFWLLGRAADLLHYPAWHILKFGTVTVAFLVPLTLYVLWRRHVPPRVAALIAGVGLLANYFAADFYEPYSWIVMAAIIPWFIEVFIGPQREGVARRNVVVLGLIGALLVTTYYYYFFVLPFFLIAYLVWAKLHGDKLWAPLRRPLLIGLVALAGSAVFWLPLVWNFATAPEFTSLNNRWLQLEHGDLMLPMFDGSLIGVLCMIGLGYLLFTARRQALSGLLLSLLAGTYLWHLAGFFLAALNNPLMSFRMKAMVPVILLTSAVLGLADLARWAAGRLDAAQLRRVVVGVAVFAAVFAADTYVGKVATSDWVKLAQDETLPDGSLPLYHDPKTAPVTPSAETLRNAIDSRLGNAKDPVILSARTDVNVYYPYYGFAQWSFAYSHPTAQFEKRWAFLKSLANVSPEEFAERTANNPYDRIDAFVLYVEGAESPNGPNLTFYYNDENYPNGSKQGLLTLHEQSFDSRYFDTVTIGNCFIAVRKS